MMYDHAERADTTTTAFERDLASWILTQLADPTSDHGESLDELCHARWTSPVPLREVPS